MTANADRAREQPVDLLDGGVVGRDVDEPLVVAVRPVVAPEAGSGQADRGTGDDDRDEQPEGDRGDPSVLRRRDPHRVTLAETRVAAHVWRTVIPPSTGTMAPLRKLAAGRHMLSVIWATSSGSP